MAPSASATRTFTGDYEAVFNAVCSAALRSEMLVLHADRVAGIISLSSPGSFWSWGENIGIRVGQVEPGSIQVSIQSTLKFGLIDWGRSARNVETLFREIDAACRGS